MLKGRLLDFGCGSKPYRSLFTVEEYTGLDFENPGHPHLNEQIDVFYDGKHMPFQDQTFDAVFSSEVFEHVFNLDEVLKELNRVMRTGAPILVTCPFAICEHEVPNDFARYSSYGLRSLFERHGFEVVHQEKTGDSIEAVAQLWIMYLHQHVNPKFRKIPGLRSAFRLITYTGLNLFALALGRILPRRQDLYLNNVILCQKLRNVL
jgi:SAM-dependent methyltransferase